MPTTAPTKPKARRTATSPLRGRMVRVLTNAELIADMKDHGRQVSKTKESAIAFLQSAGILDEAGEFADAYRV
jgi:hypothetical protein